MKWSTYAESPANPLDPSSGPVPYKSFEAVRYAMGDTLRYAQKINLVEMEPHVDLSSTGYVLANPGKEYLVLQPGETIGWVGRMIGKLVYFVFRMRGSNPFTLRLTEGTYTVDWYCVNTRKTVEALKLVVERPRATTFNAPFEFTGPTVLHLKRA